MNYIGINTTLDGDFGEFCGDSIHFYINDDEKPNIEKLIEELKYAYKYGHLQGKIKVIDLFDFIDNLRNQAKNKKLHQNLESNIKYVDHLRSKALDLNLWEEYLSAVHNNDGGRTDDREFITVFSEICPLLYDPEEFKSHFKNKLEKADELLYCSIFIPAETQKRRVEIITGEIKTIQKQVDHYTKYLKEYKDKLKELTQELKEIKKGE